MRRYLLLMLVIILWIPALHAQHSVARMWNEVLLESIRGDYARPTVHARNLFHISAAMYDAWAAYDDSSATYFLGKTNHGFMIPFSGVSEDEDRQSAQEMAISYAAYRLLSYRFRNAPSGELLQATYDSLMENMGYDRNVTTLNYLDNPAGLGNYLAEFVINYGLQDNANEQYQYANQYYQPVNEPLLLTMTGNTSIADPNRWQPLAFETFIDQGGNVISENTPEFLSPEWGKVLPFSLQESDLNIYERNGNEYWLYHDPGAPPFIDDASSGIAGQAYKRTFSLVAIWSSHLDAADTTLWDISPGAIGNIKLKEAPDTFSDYESFYKRLEGGDIGEGWELNPITNEPYEPQWVRRGDYARILAEFWADGPDSETPPGHWFTLLNYINDQPELIKKIGGAGDELSTLEWDVKSYFILGGTMHDVAVTSWGIKGYYDYIRPISAIRYMAGKGQSTDPDLPAYDPQGIPLEEGYIELVGVDDVLAGQDLEHVNKIKIYGWRGHRHVEDAATDVAGVGWVLAEEWWPYQRPSFVTPPFAGYVSGHSTYSRAAAEVLTLLTGNPFFPGGMGAFHAAKNEFLVFEEGPSEDVVLQWATYRDAADQCSLSRIWGGIHPPADDLPGRLIGEAVGKEAYEFATSYFHREQEVLATAGPDFQVYPNPVKSTLYISFHRKSAAVLVQVYDLSGHCRAKQEVSRIGNHMVLDVSALSAGHYILNVSDGKLSRSQLLFVTD